VIKTLKKVANKIKGKKKEEKNEHPKK
jgi:hypothetical protein